MRKLFRVPSGRTPKVTDGERSIRGNSVKTSPSAHWHGLLCSLGRGPLSVCLLALLVWSASVPLRGDESPAPADRSTPEELLQKLQQILPRDADDCTSPRTDEVTRAAEMVEARFTAGAIDGNSAPSHRLAEIHRLCVAKQQIDEEIDEILELRFDVASMAPGDVRREATRSFLHISSTLIGLSGRLNYELRTMIIAASYALASQPAERERLVDQLDADGSVIGASLMAPLLLDPPRDSPNKAIPVRPAVKRKVLNLLSRRGRVDILPIVVRFLRSTQLSPTLKIACADTIIRLGLSQDPQPVDDKKERGPSALLSARELGEILENIDAGGLSPEFKKHRTALLRWLKQRAGHGVGPKGYWVGQFAIKPGDWLLMRNASPYNLFTDLSPGLFTHVGVVTLWRGADGIERMVLVDVNERQETIIGKNVERMLPAPLYYAVLRHEDPQVCRKMSEVAASLIGNPMEFDLSFDLSAVSSLQGEPLSGRKITTYCAGLLLLCCQETGRPRHEFFPLPEHPASRQTVENLGSIGMRLGEELISPTGSLFARGMQLVHMSKPMYDPSRDIEQQIYNQFAARLQEKRLVPRQNLFQFLRQELADASQARPLLAQALATAAGVHPETDLASGARALSVVETLDTVAYSASREFREAYTALQGAGDLSQSTRVPGADRSRVQELQSRHAEIARLFREGRISNGELTNALVDAYVDRGKERVDRYFFGSAK